MTSQERCSFFKAADCGDVLDCISLKAIYTFDVCKLESKIDIMSACSTFESDFGAGDRAVCQCGINASMAEGSHSA